MSTRHSTSRLATFFTVLLIAATALVAAGRSASAAAPRPVLQPPSGQQAVKPGDTVTFAGSVDAGATVTDARILQRDGAGTVLRALDARDQVRADESGALSGRYVLPGMNPTPVDLVLRVTTTRAGAVEQGDSPPVPVDVEAPAIRSVAVDGSQDRIRVDFTEDVFGSDGSGDGNINLDWRVYPPEQADCNPTPTSGGQTPVRVEGTGSTRFLQLAVGYGEDATPFVCYIPAPRAPYRDRAANFLTGVNRAVHAADRIVPRVPVIEQIDGRSPAAGSVPGNSRTPSVRLGAITEGHTAEVYVDSDGSATLDVTRDARVGSAGAGADGATVPVADLGEDGAYRLLARAVDPSGNASGGSTPVVYLLDTVAPVLAGALAPDNSRVEVTFTEPVGGPDNPADWTVRAPDSTPRVVTAVSGTGSSRTLSVNSVPAGSTLSYTPAGSGYTDAAGNAVRQPATVVIGARLPPVITSPDPDAGTAHTQAATFEVRGTVEPDTEVRLYRDDDGNGVPDAPGDPVGTADVPPGVTVFAIPVALGAGDPPTTTRLLASATDPATGASSALTAVPPIVRDTRPPEIPAIVSPAPGAVLRSGAQQRISWRMCDHSFGPGPARIELALDGVNFDTATPIATAAGTATTDCSTTQSFDGWTVPSSPASAARLRVVAVDLAGNSAVTVSEPFAIDATAPVFTALTQARDTVDLTFSEPVDGTIAPADFTIEGVPASSVTVTEGESGDGRLAGAAVRRLRLRTATPTFEVNDTPRVTYSPALRDQQLRDAAGHEVPAQAKSVLAVDGIVPVPPVVTSPAGDVLTTATTQVITGTSERKTTVAASKGGVVVREVPVDDQGRFSVSVPLTPDADNVFSLVAVDSGPNASGATATPRITQDASDPAVRVTSPRAGDELPNERDVTITWSASDVRLAPQPITVEYSMDGGRSWVVLVRDGANSGSTRWRTPSERSSQAVVRVSARDQAGRVGSATSGLFGLGQPPVVPAGVSGYWTVASDGGIFAFGDAPFHGSTGAIRLNEPIVAMAATPTGDGYWLVARDGGIFAFGDARFHGSTGGRPLNQPIVGMAATPTGRGYWLVASDGGVFAFGDARFAGSTGAIRLNEPIVAMAPTRSGEGYWLAARDGGIFAFGDARFRGSMGGRRLNQPMVGMAALPGGDGYWLVASDGGVFAFGDARFAGSTGAIRLNEPIVGMAPTPSGGGYWMVARDGGIFAFGDAMFRGSMGGHRLNQPMVGMAPRLRR